MTAARLAVVFAGSFVVLLVAVHVLKSDLAPSWHFISEYAIGRHGWVMQGAFLALAAANAAVLVALHPFLRNIWGRVASALFAVGTIGVVLAAVFVTDPVNTAPDATTTSGMLHNLGGGLGLFGFLGTLIMSGRLLRHESWRTARKPVAVATAILVVGFFVAFVGISAIAAQHEGIFGPDTPIGWPNRIGILSGSLWIALIAHNAPRP